MPSEANLSPRAAERVCRESAQKAFDEAAKSLNVDWGLTLDGKQLQRWSEALGRGMVRQRDRQGRAYRKGRYPQGPANAPQLLVIGMDGRRLAFAVHDPTGHCDVVKFWTPPWHYVARVTHPSAATCVPGHRAGGVTLGAFDTHGWKPSVAGTAKPRR